MERFLLDLHVMAQALSLCCSGSSVQQPGSASLCPRPLYALSSAASVLLTACEVKPGVSLQDAALRPADKLSRARGGIQGLVFFPRVGLVVASLWAAYFTLDERSFVSSSDNGLAPCMSPRCSLRFVPPCGWILT